MNISLNRKLNFLFFHNTTKPSAEKMLNIAIKTEIKPNEKNEKNTKLVFLLHKKISKNQNFELYTVFSELKKEKFL